MKDVSAFCFTPNTYTVKMLQKEIVENNKELNWKMSFQKRLNATYIDYKVLYTTGVVNIHRNIL